MEPIRCEGLTKRFRGMAAVEGLDLSVREGEVFGFLGPNGAGKTTTIRMLLGLIRPDAGQASILGDKVPCPSRLGEVGALLENAVFYPWLTGRQNLLVVAETGSPVPPAQVDECLEAAGIGSAASRRVKTFSQGMRQRLGLAAALLRRPKLLILDEPTNGLDPAGIHEFRHLIRSLAREGTSIFLSTHLLREAEQICDRVAILSRGQLRGIEKVDKVRVVPGQFELVVSREESDRALALLQNFRVTVERPGRLIVECGSGGELNRILVAGGVYAEAIVPVRSELEERFLALTQKR